MKGSINTIIGFINRLIGAWNLLEFHIPGFSVGLPSVNVPGVGQIGGGNLGWGGVTVSTPDLPTIPELATGGIVTRPTLAMLGEAGPEAVVPLRGSRLPSTVNITINVERILGKDEEMLDWIERGIGRRLRTMGVMA